ncbi:MAG: hypothetical protein HRT67_09815 [Flavobacteriaceae bacterium]|nr:hypothetical protein [Flavobacteriaceae bacterium]
MNDFNDLQNRIKTSKHLDFGNILNDAIALFKKGWLQGFLMLLLQFVLILPLMLVVYIPMLFLGGLNFQVFDKEVASVLALIIFVLVSLFAILTISVVAFAIQAGFFRICRQLDRGENQGFDYLYFLKRKYLSKIATIMLIALGINIAAVLLCVLPVFYVAIPIAMIPVVFAFNTHLSASDIVKLSFDLGNKKWFLIFGLTLVSAFLSELVGVLMCGIGLFLTMSFIFVPKYFVYKETLGFDEDIVINEIGVTNM